MNKFHVFSYQRVLIVMQVINILSSLHEIGIAQLKDSERSDNKFSSDKWLINYDGVKMKKTSSEKETLISKVNFVDDTSLTCPRRARNHEFMLSSRLECQVSELFVSICWSSKFVCGASCSVLCLLREAQGEREIINVNDEASPRN